MINENVQNILFARIIADLGCNVKDLNLFKSKLNTLLDTYVDIVKLIEFKDNFINMNEKIADAPAMAVISASFKHLMALDKDNDLKEIVTACNNQINTINAIMPNYH